MTTTEHMELFLLPIPAAGHFTSMVSMASGLLAIDRRLSVTVLLMTTPAPCFNFDSSSCLRSLRSSLAGAGNIRFEELPELPLENFSEEHHQLAALFSLYVDRHKPIVKAAVARRLCPAGAASAALVIDFFATSMVDVADDLGIPTYLYFTTSAASLALILHAPTLDAKRQLPVDLDGDGEEVFVELPAMPPTPARAMPAFMLSCRRESYECFLYHGRRFIETKGIIVNTFSELESPVLDALRTGAYVPDRPTPPVFAVGPVLGLQPVGDADATGRHECIKWLDDQPPASVVFLCFGSLTVFSAAQVSETAKGLANSGHRFLWALITSDGGDSESVLPEEFLKRTAERGKVWTTWAPQAAILAHAAVGGFVTHCGWNSSLEGMWEGVPMLAWPGKAEQHFVAFRLAAEGAGVAMEMKMERRSGESVVTAEELERGVRRLMEKEEEEGRRVRRLSEEVKAASRRAVEVGGSSYIAMQRLAEHMLGINMKINKI